jgi:hypothetical protein
MVYVACAALAALAGFYVLIPLFKEPKGNLEVELLAETELDRLLNRKAIVYTNLKDLEFEYKLGRLADADFQRLEAGYKAEAAHILQKLDQLGVEKNIDEIIERDVTTRRSKLFSSGSPPAPQSATRCPACGTATIAGKKFCADCGHQLQ